MDEVKNLNQFQMIQNINSNINGVNLINVNSEKDLRMSVLHIFYDLIAELENEGPDFKKIQSRLVDKLDAAVFEHKCDNEFRQSFNTLLYDKINVMDKPWKEKGLQMIQNLTKLIDLLIDYRLVLNDDENRDKQMTCIANLLNFYKNEIYKKELYVKYIYKLYDLHVQAENFTEVAFTLKMHADLFGWTFNPIKEFTMHNDNQILNQSTSDKLEWQRKEQLYLKIIDYFDKGKCWEEALPLIKEMENFYDKYYEYSKLSNIIKKKAGFYDNILTQFRFEPEYFRVAFFGMGFPLFLRNRMFVYKGNDFEKISDFIQRISKQYSTAEILTKNNPPDNDILQSNKQYIQIISVKPIPDLPIELEVQQNANEKICTYYLMNQVRKFVYDRPIHKDPIDKDNEFKSLWSERTILTIEKKLPGILRWFEIIDRHSYELTPVENACDVIENMSKELKKLIISYAFDSNKQLTPLTMRLQGVIDASVNGGLRKYQEAFFDPKFIESHLHYYVHIKRLKKLIFNQISILENGLVVHKRLVPQSLQPLHDLLVERFSSMKNSFITDSAYVVDIGICEKKPSILNTPLPPIPVQNKFKSNKELSFVLNSSNTNEDEIYSVPDSDGKVSPFSRQTPDTSGPPLPPLRPKSATYLNNGSNINLSELNLAHNLTNNNSIIINNNINNNNNNNNNKLVHIVPILNSNNNLLNQRSKSMPRNSHLQSNQFLISSSSANHQYPYFDNLKQPHSPTNFIQHNPPLPPRFTQAKYSFESGLESDLSEHELSKPFLPKRASKKSNLTNSEPSPMLISIEIDKSKQSLNTVISSNHNFTEDTNQNIPPPLPMKKRIPASRSTTIITIGNTDLDNNFNNNSLPINSILSNNLTNSNLLQNNHHNLDNNLLKSTSSSISTLSMSTSSSTNEYSFTETQKFNSVTNTITSITSSSNSKVETTQHQIQNFHLNE